MEQCVSGFLLRVGNISSKNDLFWQEKRQRNPGSKIVSSFFGAQYRYRFFQMLKSADTMDIDSCIRYCWRLDIFQVRKVQVSSKSQLVSYGYQIFNCGGVDDSVDWNPLRFPLESSDGWKPEAAAW